MKKNSFFKIIFTLPTIVYTVMLIVLPFIYILFLSFTKNDSYGGIIYEFTLSNYLAVFDKTYLTIFFKSAIIGIVATFICILISYPFALILRKKSKSIKNLSTKYTLVKIKREPSIKSLRNSIFYVKIKESMNGFCIGEKVPAEPQRVNG